MSLASLLTSWRPVVAFLTVGGLLLACTLGEAPKKKRTPVDCDVEDCYADLPVDYEAPIAPDKVNANSGAFGAPERPSSHVPDAGPDAASDDGGTRPKTYCGTPLAAGDLAIVEIMITSKSGSDDSGEWVEIQNARDCWLKLGGVSVVSPRGTAAPNVANIPDDVELEPHGTFVVADSTDALKNHDIPGVVIGWNATDVLKNDGDTIKVKVGTVVIDSLTYPAFTNLTAGRTLAFPSDCKSSDRTDWARWSLTFNEFSPGFKGTPNAPNTDVVCF